MVGQTFRMMQMRLRNVQTKNPNVFTWANLNAQKCKHSCFNLEMHVIDYMNEISFEWFFSSSLLTMQVYI